MFFIMEVSDQLSRSDWNIIHFVYLFIFAVYDWQYHLIYHLKLLCFRYHDKASAKWIERGIMNIVVSFWDLMHMHLQVIYMQWIYSQLICLYWFYCKIKKFAVATYRIWPSDTEALPRKDCSTLFVKLMSAQIYFFKQ